jgi:hypothetical protein
MKRLTVKTDNSERVLRALKELSGKEVLVGFPQSTAARDDGPINNAAIAYVMENGSPEHNVPARPFLVPGVRRVLPQALAQVGKAVVALVDGNRGKADEALNAAGIIAMNSARREIGSNIPPPLKPSTIRGRKYARGTKSRRDSENKYLALVKGGMTPSSAQSATGIIALINTGQLRNALTYVVRKHKRN